MKGLKVYKLRAGIPPIIDRMQSRWFFINYFYHYPIFSLKLDKRLACRVVAEAILILERNNIYLELLFNAWKRKKNFLQLKQSGFQNSFWESERRMAYI